MNKINVAVVSGRELKPDDLLLRMIREDGSLYYVGTVSNEDEVKNLMELDPPDMLLFSSIVPKLWRRDGRLFSSAQNLTGTRYGIPGSALPLREENLELIVSNILHELGVPTHISGFGFIRDAVILAVYDQGQLGKITKVMYPTIAKKNMTTPSKVERSIRHAIDLAWERGSLKYIDELFGSDLRDKRIKPTNSEFIALIADKIRIDWKNRKY